MRLLSQFYTIMQGQQNYLSALKGPYHASPHSLLNKIESENAKIKLLVNSCRERSHREEDLLANDSDLSKNQVLSQNRSIRRQNSRIPSKRHSFFDNPKETPTTKFYGDQLLHQRNTKNNFFKHNQQLSKYYERLNPLAKNTNSKLLPNPEATSRIQNEMLGIRSEKQIESHKRISIFRVKSKIDSHNVKQAKALSMPKPKKKVQFREVQNVQIDAIDIKMFASHINTLPFLHANSTPEAIFTFFESIYQTLRAKKISEPVIKKYKNCVYYGERVTESNTLYQGMIWYYREAFYFGELTDGKKHGKGIQIKYQKGQPCIWRGKFTFGHKNGYFEVEKPGYRFNGKLKDGEFDGQGHLISANSEYKGLFCDGLKEGLGWEKFTNKSEYKGEYFNNKYDGQGELKAPNYYYKGLFKKGRPDGFGFERTSEFEYLGTFVMGKKQGKGKLKTSDGTCIECEFKNGLIVEQKNREVQSPKQVVIDNYLSKELHALNEESDEETLENMLNEINNTSHLRISPMYA